MQKGKIVLLVLIILSYLPILFVALTLLSLNLITAEENILFLASIFGLTGFLIMWWQYILGARFVFRIFTRDLIWVNNIHKLLGKYGFLLIVVHPVLIYLDRILYGLGITLPDFTNIYDRNVFLGQLSIFILGSIWVTSAITRGKLSFRFWKRIHLLTYPLLFLLFIHSTSIGKFLGQGNTPLFNFYWNCLFVVFVLVVIGRLLFQFGILKSKYLVKEVSKITHDTFTLKLLPASKHLNPKKGQFIYIQHNLIGEAHPYTVSFYDNQTGELHISTKDLGKFSRELQALPSGHKVFVDGPYGVFTLEAYTAQSPIVLIAGGIGITPFCRLLEYFKANPDKNPGITLFYGNKSEEDIAFKDLIDGFVSSKFKAVHVLSAQETVPDGFEKGFITTSLLKEYLGELPTYKYFLCGPPVMITKLIPDLMSAGVSKEAIYSEKFSM